MRFSLLILALTSLLGVLAKQPTAHYRDLPTLRKQDELEKAWVQKRYELIPSILKKYGYDAWILSMREYAEDTAFRALVSSTTTFSARRRTLFMFHTDPSVPSPFHYVELKEELWEALNETLHKVDPKKIAVNIDEDMAFSDGLHTGEGRLLLSKLGPYADRVSSERGIGVETVAARVGGEEQLSMYKLMMENVWAMVQEGFSERAVEVGKTTAEDLEWWFRDVMRWRFGTGTWFPPTVNIYRSPAEPSAEEDPYMRPGDLLHVDIGITAMGMNTDTQHLGYILRHNETSPPASLIKGLHDANKLQDFVRKQMVPGRTGDEVFAKVSADMEKAGLKGRIYSHPIGDYGHSAGAIIGMANNQGPISGGGQNKVLENYWTSVELAGVTYIPEWGIEQAFELEEDVYWDEKTKTFEWVFGQQTEIHLVKPKYSHKKHSWLTLAAGKLGWEVVKWQ
ncbi:hypothetical protein BCR39DRAFT_513004 [Naematelia encephala]|uniref:Peptidase M24 domain-containing protein n=1 Tax=Naematelia encephala TaxID=71784 RepID=A0A1Y2BMI5_9TREE|nr:hypothetical protein BCR39DRAFT_513004 [Naematelia encephala]